MTHEVWETTLVNSLNLAILVLDEHLCILKSNQSAQSLLRASGGHLHGRKLQQVVKLDEDCLKQCQFCLTSRQSFTLREVVFALPAQTDLLLDLTVTPLESADKQGALLLELQLKDRFSRLSQSQYIQNQRHSAVNLVQNLSQEIHNPLSAIKGTVQLLQEEINHHISHAEQRQSWQEYTQVVIKETNRLGDLIEKLLGPRRSVEKQPNNIHLLIDQTIGLLQTEVEKKLPITWQRDFDPSIPQFMLDSSQIIQVLINMGRNSIAALHDQALLASSESNSKSALVVSKQDGWHITFKTRTVRNFTIDSVCHRLVCCISIIDNGTGVDSLLKEQIFLPMVTHRRQSNGLGLSIAYNLVMQHEGAINLTSYQGYTQFDIYLPIS